MFCFARARNERHLYPRVFLGRWEVRPKVWKRVLGLLIRLQHQRVVNSKDQGRKCWLVSVNKPPPSYPQQQKGEEKDDEELHLAGLTTLGGNRRIIPAAIHSSAVERMVRASP